MFFCITHTIQLLDQKVMIVVQYKKQMERKHKERMSMDGGPADSLWPRARSCLQLSSATVWSSAAGR